MPFKKISVFFLLIIFTFSLSACNSAGNENAVKEENNEEALVFEVPELNTTDEIRLTLWWADTPGHREFITQVVKDFEEAHKNIKIDIQWQVGFDDTIKLKTALLAGTAPDIMKVNHSELPVFGANKQILDLRKVGAEEIEDLFIPSTWKASKYESSVFGLPFDANAIVLFYNRDILSRVNADPPKNFAEIKSLGEKVKNLNEPDIYTYTLPTSAGDGGWITFQWLTWLWRNGGDVLNEENMSEAVFNSEAGVNALTQVQELVQEGIASQNQYLEGDFYTGTVALLDMGNWSLSKIENNEYAQFGVSQLPQLKEGVTAYSGLGLYSMIIKEDSKNPREAFEFIKFMTTTDKYPIQYAKDIGLMPSLKSAYSDKYFDTENWKIFKDALDNSKSRPSTPYWPEIDEEITIAIQRVLFEGVSPKAALDEAADNVNNLLN